MSERARPLVARNYLHWAKSLGYIFGFEMTHTPDGLRWIIETAPTRLEHYRDNDARGTIVLSTREVMAFTEGLWAASGVRPVNRAGSGP